MLRGFQPAHPHPELDTGYSSPTKGCLCSRGPRKLCSKYPDPGGPLGTAVPLPCEAAEIDPPPILIPLMPELRRKTAKSLRIGRFLYLWLCIYIHDKKSRHHTAPHLSVSVLNWTELAQFPPGERVQLECVSEKEAQIVIVHRSSCVHTRTPTSPKQMAESTPCQSAPRLLAWLWQSLKHRSRGSLL